MTERLKKVADTLLELEKKCSEESADVSLYMNKMIDILSKADVMDLEPITLNLVDIYKKNY